MTPEQLLHYSRHLAIPEVGKDGQEKLLNAKVLIVGIGGLGCPVSLYLAAAGIGELGLIDFDTVSVSNLHRQILYTNAHIGDLKVDAATRRLAEINPGITLNSFSEKLTSDNALTILKDYDYVIDGTDNFATRYLVNDACVLLNKINVYGSIYRWEGQSSVFCAEDGPCYRCLFPEPPPVGEVPSCDQAGVIGVLPGIIGLIQASETIKMILEIGESLVGRTLIFDLLTMRQKEIKLTKNPDCPMCGEIPSIHELMDCTQFCNSGYKDENQKSLNEGLITKEISALELKALVDVGADHLLLDVRDPFEFDIVKIENAKLIPLSELENRIDEITQYKNQTMIVYCHHGMRGRKAAEILKSKGFKNLHNLTGGIDSWAEAVDIGLPRY